MNTYTLGIDYGTLSARCVLMNCRTGEIIAQAACPYPHAVLDRFLPDGTTKLDANDALEVPADYITALKETVRSVMRDSGAAAEQVIGLGIDFTSCTLLPTDAEGIPLCEKTEHIHNKHAYVKLWKHHGAQDEADQINEVLTELGMIDEPRYGGAISPELLLPKVMEVLHDDPALYEEAYVFLEAGDWLTWLLTGTLKRSGNMAAYKAMWTPEDGYIPAGVLRRIDPRLEHLVSDKLKGDVCPPGGCIGRLNAEWADLLGLKEGIAVAPTVIDSHAGLPGSGIHRMGQMMLVLGTSSVELLLSESPYSANGVVGAVKGAIMPGYYSLEAGLAAVGDMYGWFTDLFVPASYTDKAKDRGLNIHQYLSELAGQNMPGRSGVMALDWWNGNKTPYVNGNLSGVLCGLTLQTRPEDIYRALIEATAYGTRMIMEEFMKSGAPVDEVIVSGGIAEKNPFVLDIFANVLNKPMKISASDQTAALGSAMYAAAAAGVNAGGYDSISDAAGALGRVKAAVCHPDPEKAACYDTLYQLYSELVTAFDPKSVSILEKLRAMRG